MKTITEQIAELTPTEKTTLINALDITYTHGNNTYTYITGAVFLDELVNLFGDWYVNNLKITLGDYHTRNKSFFSQFLSGLAVDLTKQVNEHTETVTDIAPPTVDSYTTAPETKETYKKAPFDSGTTQTESERMSITNNGIEYKSGKAVTSYDTTTNTNLSGHVSKTVNDKSGTNYPLSKILTEEENRRLTDYFYRYCATYCAEYGYRIGVIF